MHLKITFQKLWLIKYGIVSSVDAYSKYNLLLNSSYHFMNQSSWAKLAG